MRSQFKKYVPFLFAVLISLKSAVAFEGNEPPASIPGPKLESQISGYVKTLSLFTRTSGANPELVDYPLAKNEAGENVFSTNERIRIKTLTAYAPTLNHRLIAKVEYDHQVRFGSFVGTGDFRLGQKLVEDRQFLDLGQTLVEKENAFYDHGLHRASLTYQGGGFEVEAGRQLIPWGKGRFFTPTDLFNRFNPTQVEFDEREGTDAVNLIVNRMQPYTIQFVYTPRGKRLHPARYLSRISRDIKEYEVGILGGRINRDHVVGFDLAGNIKSSAVRGEFLFDEAKGEKDFIKFTVNADYNFPKNIYALLEYHFNGQGRRRNDSYDLLSAVRGEIQQLSKNYLALQIGHDLTPLIRIENKTIFNMNDLSFFIRPELQYQMAGNLFLTLAAHLFFGDSRDEFGSPKNIFFGDLKYSF